MILDNRRYLTEAYEIIASPAMILRCRLGLEEGSKRIHGLKQDTMSILDEQKNSFASSVHRSHLVFLEQVVCSLNVGVIVR
ncbi:hypothetical protein M5689_005457 [Euphorbia peplus]|nr:hypothetical protein M5689_005457 [Euphorbia peplus]